MTLTDENNRWSSGSVRFFPQDPKLTSCSKKSVDIAVGMHGHQGRSSIDESHFLPRAFHHNDIRHTYLTGTNLSFPHTLGVHDPKIPESSQCFVRTEEAALGISFNAQSQAPDIPGISTRNFAIHIVLKNSIQGSGHPLTVVVWVYGRGFGFLQRPRSSSQWSFCPGSSVWSTWFLRNTAPFQKSVLKVVYTVFHRILSNTTWLSIQWSSDTSSYPNYRTTGFFAKGV